MINTLNLDQFAVQEMNAKELKDTEGGAGPLFLVAGAVVGVLVVGALVGYGVYKFIDWLTH